MPYKIRGYVVDAVTVQFSDASNRVIISCTIDGHGFVLYCDKIAEELNWTITNLQLGDKESIQIKASLENVVQDFLDDLVFALKKNDSITYDLLGTFLITLKMY